MMVVGGLQGSSEEAYSVKNECDRSISTESIGGRRRSMNRG